MSNPHAFGRIERTAWAALVAILAVLLLVGGVAWHGLAAQTTQTRAIEPRAAAEAAPRTVAGLRDSYADVVKIVAPGVVTIRTESKVKASPTQFQGEDLFRRFFGQEFGQMEPQQPRSYRERALGSGVIVDPSGYILTNYHVVGNADQIKVDLHDGRTLDGKLIGSDKPSDLALVKVNASNLHALALGDSDKVQIGDVVLAVGNPFGLGQTVTMGIISVMDQLRATGHVTRAQLGVVVQQVTPEMAQALGLSEAKGAIVASVQPGSAAARAGIKQGDVIESFMGKPVQDTNTLRNRVAESKPGSTEPVTILRDGTEKTIDVTLGEVKTGSGSGRSESDTNDKAALGVAVEPLTPELARRVGVPPGTKGVVVDDVDPNGRAADVGIQSGDVIESVNRQPVTNVDDLRRLVQANSTRPMVLLVDHQGAQLFVTVPPEQ
jgi:S1-C subfamily serine protease